ncbi:MAG: transporter substrate-binding domain-containing protein [Candidatus Methylopumilus sp.]|nr:transporter substrate-binding domain-containing protein [Candidatus Methylopumilus sp.]
MSKQFKLLIFFMFALFLSLIIIGCSDKEKAVITDIKQLNDKDFGIPTGTVADKLVLSVFPNAKFQYYNSILDAAIAVQQGKVTAAAYDEPILRNIAAKNPGLTVLSEMITKDDYGFAIRLEDGDLKNTIDGVIKDLKTSGDYEQMLGRWLPKEGQPKSMPRIETGNNGKLRFGTSSVTEPFSFVDESQKVVGIDIEIASLVAKKLNKKLEIVNMEFGSLIPALASKKVDMIGACITITEERSKKVLFSNSYYTGGIAAIVKK